MAITFGNDLTWIPASDLKPGQMGEVNEGSRVYRSTNGLRLDGYSTSPQTEQFGVDVMVRVLPAGSTITITSEV